MNRPTAADCGFYVSLFSSTLFYRFPLFFCNLDSKEHPLRPHRDYVGYLYQRMDALSERESLEVSIFTGVKYKGIIYYYLLLDPYNVLCQFGVRDFLHSPLQVSIL